MSDLFSRLEILLDQSPEEMNLEIRFVRGISGLARWEIGRTKRLMQFADQDSLRTVLGHVSDGILLHHEDGETISLNKPLTGQGTVVKFRYQGTHTTLLKPNTWNQSDDEEIGHWWYRKFKSKAATQQWVKANQDWIELGDTQHA